MPHKRGLMPCEWERDDSGTTRATTHPAGSAARVPWATDGMAGVVAVVRFLDTLPTAHPKGNPRLAGVAALPHVRLHNR